MRKTMFFLVVFAMAGSLWAADPIIGTWKLNIAKSTHRMAPRSPLPKEWTEVYREIEGGQIEFTMTMILTDGSSSLLKGVWPAQGGTMKVLQGGNPAVSYVQTLIEPGNWYRTALRDGKQVGFIHKTFSKDGKTMRQTHKGSDAQGRPYEDLRVYDKQ